MEVVLTSAVLAISETTVPGSVDSQPYLLTLAGLIGFAGVWSYITELFFWTLLIGLFGFSKFVKKRDYVSAALPVAAVLAAVGEPWVRIIAIASYIAMAIVYRYMNPVDRKEDGDGGGIRKVPVPLICAVLAIGVSGCCQVGGVPAFDMDDCLAFQHVFFFWGLKMCSVAYTLYKHVESFLFSLFLPLLLPDKKG